MANMELNIDAMIIPTALQAVATANPSLQGTPPADWNVDHFRTIQIWSNAGLEDAQILTQGADLTTEITNNTISARTAVRCLRLALSLRSMSVGNNNPLIVQQARNDQAIPALLEMPNLELFSGSPFSIRGTQVGAQLQPPVVQQAMIAVNNPPAQNQNADPQDKQIKAYTFIAAFLMRLIVKAPENVITGLANMKTRYETFYGPSLTVARFSITLQQAATLKEALLSQTLIGQTMTHAIANTHQNHVPNLTQNEIGVLSYLCFLPFAYTGMHAYTMMSELKAATNITLDKLLALFYCDITAPAINKIVDIVRDFERTETNPNRDVTFRYCTLWAPHYFAAVRSRNSVHLVYTVACTWKELKATGDHADPEQIAAASILSATMKRTLKRAGVIIGSALKTKMLSGANASVAYTMALQNPDNLEVDPEVSDDEFNHL